MQIFLIRHGQDLNPDQDRLTDTDQPLSELGRQQAANCAAKIREVLNSNITPVIISSPRLRTMQTAAILATELGENSASVKSDTRLKERDCAAYSGQIVAEVFSKAEEELVAGGMEAYSKLIERLGLFYDDLLIENNAQTIIVTHSGNIQPLIKLAGIDYSGTLAPDNFIRLK